MTRDELIRRARQGLKVAGDVAGVAVQLRTDSGPLGIASLVAKLGSSLLEQTDRFPLEGWNALSGISDMGDFCMRVAHASGLIREVPSTQKSTRAIAGNIGGVQIGWSQYDHWIDGPFVAPGESEADAVRAMRVLVWTSIGRQIKFKPPIQGQIRSGPSLAADGLDETRASTTALDLWYRQEKFLKAGHRRSVLLVGEPNTGKSNIVRHIAALAGGYTLRIDARDVDQAQSIGHLVQFLCPDAVILDDLDRCSNPGGVIAQLDDIMRHTQLVLVTVNKLKQPKPGETTAIKGLDPAAVRRFDDVRVITSLDDAVLDAMLDGIPKAVADRLRVLPIGYIDKFKRSMEVLGYEQAALELDELIEQRELVVSLLEPAPADTIGIVAEKILV